jgi:hypothetical protein
MILASPLEATYRDSIYSRCVNKESIGKRKSGTCTNKGGWDLFKSKCIHFNDSQ